MIVDDQSFNILAMQAQLKLLGVPSDKAESGEKAILVFTEKLERVLKGEETMYKVIFLDYNMQDGMNGPDTAMQMFHILTSY